MEAHPQAGAITGKPAVPRGQPLSFAEKLNLVANLMDVLPPAPTRSSCPWASPRVAATCSARSAVEAAGFYDTTLRTAGEDQVLAARLRSLGYEVYQAPFLNYVLSVSEEQDTVGKLVRHQRLFGRAHPYILLSTRHASRGVAGAEAGANRRARLLLRLQQVAATGALAAAVGLAAFGRPVPVLALLAGTAAVKLLLFRRHLAAVRLRAAEWLAFLALQPVLDASYSVGLLTGLVRVATGSPARPID